MLERSCLQPLLDDQAHLQLAYGYMLQDRIALSTAHFAKIDAARLGSGMIYDYLGAYLAFAHGELATAEKFASRWKDYPIERWRLRFGEVLAQLEEIAGRIPQRESALAQFDRQALQTSTSTSIQARLIDNAAIAISSVGLPSCSVRFHRLDLELQFSRAPFDFDVAKRSILIAPNQELEVALPHDGMAHVEIPEALRSVPLAIVVQGGDQQLQLTSLADGLEVRLSPSTGQVQVMAADGSKPLALTYVKVYARDKDGVVSFHKDGYTDLRGRFDYASLGTGKALTATRFALFISNDAAGSVVREVAAP